MLLLLLQTRLLLLLLWLLLLLRVVLVLVLVLVVVRVVLVLVLVLVLVVRVGAPSNKRVSRGLGHSGRHRQVGHAAHGEASQEVGARLALTPAMPAEGVDGGKTRLRQVSLGRAVDDRHRVVAVRPGELPVPARS